MRTLLVDDSRTMREIIRAILAPLGLSEIDEAEDAPEGVAALDASLPDLAIIDAGLGGALDLVREARSRGARLPIVVISADRAPARAAEARDAGATAYVVKPFTPDVLSQRLGELIEHAGAGA